MTLFRITDDLLEPESALWLEVAPVVRMAVENGHSPVYDFDDWERLMRKKGTLAVDAMLWLKDAADSGQPTGAGRDFTSEQRQASLEAFHLIKAHATPKG